MANRTTKRISRLKRKQRIRKNIKGTPLRPRLSVFRSSGHVYAQVIDDIQGHTIVSASSLESAFKAGEIKGSGKEGAAAVGKLVGQRALEKGIKQVSFDRNGFLYHGRVKAVSDGAREAGLNF